MAEELRNTRRLVHASWLDRKTRRVEVKKESKRGLKRNRKEEKPPSTADSEKNRRRNEQRK